MGFVAALPTSTAHPWAKQPDAECTNICQSHWGSFKNTHAWASSQADSESPGERIQLPMDSNVQPGLGNTGVVGNLGFGVQMPGFHIALTPGSPGDVQRLKGAAAVNVFGESQVVRF